MWRQVVAQSPGENAPAAEVVRYDVGWKALNTMLKSGRSLSGHERNCCFFNTQGRRFADVSAAANIDFDDDGRVLALSDWDQDGDLDFWIANRTGPQVRFLRNDADNKHNFVAFKLTGVTCNRDAIGARVELHVSDSDHPHRRRTLRAGEGYLAQSSKWLHFGLGDFRQIDHAVVVWPDGTQETLRGIEPNRRYRVRQGTAEAIPWNPPPRDVGLVESKIEVPPTSDQSRIVLIAPIPLPSMEFTQRSDGAQAPVANAGQPRLVNLWASWCQPCIRELKEWGQHADVLRQSGLEIVTINVDEPGDDPGAQRTKIDHMLDALQLPFTNGYGSTELAAQFDVVQRGILQRQRPLPVPSSFLIDARGCVRVIYKGQVGVEQLVADAKLLEASAEEIVAACVPYPGKWLGQPGGSPPNQIAVKFLEGGYVKEAEQYLRQLTQSEVPNPMYNEADAYVLLGAICLDQKRYIESAAAFREALARDPEHRQSHIELAGILMEQNQPAEAAYHYEAALKRRSNDPELRLKLGLARLKQGHAEQALLEFEKALRLRPSALAHHHLGNTLVSLNRISEAITNFEAAVRMNPTFSAPANNLAWLLATHEAVLDGPRAVEIAEQLCGSADGRTAGNLDTLAAAYAEVGRFPDAVRTATTAVRLARAEGNAAKSQRIEKRLAGYRQDMPFREE